MFILKKIDFVPIVPIPILHKQAKITDLISNVNAGSSLHLVMSKKLKEIIEKYRKTGLQFFETSISKNGVEFNNYFSMNMFISDMKFINFTKSKISVSIRKSEGGTELKPLLANSLEEFLNIVDFHKQKMEIVSINNICLNEGITENFFMIQHPVKYIVSEKLKQEIENSGCTGIEFQPVELSYNEWTMLGGEREKVYGKM